MKKIFFLIVPLMIGSVLIYSCTPKAKYERKLKHELASGVRNDSLFLGLYFGMTEKEFFTHCWKLNQKGLIKQGGSNTTVEYHIQHELKYPCQMDFYPKFVDHKIAEMPVRFVYSGWAPWNKDLSSDKLELDIMNWYKTSFGEFMEVRHPSKGSAYVNISGNRQISIFKEDELHVWAVFTDMTVKEKVDSLAMLPKADTSIAKAKADSTPAKSN
jgi:hypothetical protein